MLAERLGVKARVQNTKATIRREVAVFRDAGRDVVDRFAFNGPAEPGHSQTSGGLLGQRGSLLKTPIVMLTRTLDIVAAHTQGASRINRAGIRTLRRR